MITATTIWVVSVLAAVLSCIVSITKLINRRRQLKVPSLSLREYRYSDSIGPIANLFQRKPPLMSGKQHEHVAVFSEISPMFQTGDLISFSGRTLFGYSIRGFTYSDKSHIGIMLVVTSANKDEVARILGITLEEGTYIVDSCEGMGVTVRDFHQEVKDYPGQYYWHATAKEFRYLYKREKIAVAALTAVRNNTKYGWAGVILQFILHFPILRTLAYAIGFASCKRFTQRPFCSMGATTWIRASSVDPVPGRDAQLIVPQELCQSMLFPEGIALLP